MRLGLREGELALPFFAEDVENAVVKTRENVPVYVKNVANVTLGPALRRGALDKEGAEAVGGVVVARYGDNPLAVIKNVKARINETREALQATVLIKDAEARCESVEVYAAMNGLE